jgi:hypothetical protein
MFTPLDGWAVGPPGKGPRIVHDAVLKTTDGGVHWLNLTPPGFQVTLTGLSTFWM